MLSLSNRRHLFSMRRFRFLRIDFRQAIRWGTVEWVVAPASQAMAGHFPDRPDEIDPMEKPRGNCNGGLHRFSAFAKAAGVSHAATMNQSSLSDTKRTSASR